MASSANHVHYGAVWPALLLRARQKVSLGSLAGPQSSAADQTHGGEINHLTVQAAAAAVEQRQQSVQQLLCLCQLPLAVPLAGRAATSRVDRRSSRRPGVDLGTIDRFLCHGHRLVGSRARGLSSALLFIKCTFNWSAHLVASLKCVSATRCRAKLVQT